MSDSTNPQRVDVERFGVACKFSDEDGAPEAYMCWQPNGEYVRYSDYAALLQKLAERDAQLGSMQHAAEILAAEVVAAEAAIDAAAMILTKDVDGDWVLASDGVTGTLAEIDAMLGQRVRLVATSGGE